MTGSIAILNVASGDTKLSFDPANPAEVKRSSRIVRDMIRRGFVILIEVGSDEKGPLYRRALDFDEAAAEYIIAGEPGEQPVEDITHVKPSIPPRQRQQKAPKAARQRIPAARTKAVATARTAGG